MMSRMGKVINYKGKKIGAYLYTIGKFGKGYREVINTDYPFLYSGGVYPTKLTASDLPDDYIPIHSRVIWYMRGFLRTAGITDMKYTYVKENHLFKDDYIYISYHGKIKKVDETEGIFRILDYVDYDVCVCGNDIVDIVLASEKYSGFDTAEVRKGIEEKRVWLRDNEPDYYERCVGEDEDIFSLWHRKGYVA